MIDRNKFRGAAMAHGYTLKKLARELKITPETLRRNIRTGMLSVKYVVAIKQILGLSDIEVLEIFFGQQEFDF